MRHPAALLVVPLLAGTMLALVSPFDGVAPLATASACAWCAAAWSAHRQRLRSFVSALIVSAATAGAALAMQAGQEAARPSLVLALETDPAVLGNREPVRLVGRLRRDAEVADAGVRLDLDVDRVLVSGAWLSAGGRAGLSVRGALAPWDAHAWRAGRRLRVWAALREPTVYRNPGVSERRATVLRERAVVGTVKSARLVEVVAHGSPAAEAAARLRAFVRRVVIARVGRHSRRAAAIVIAILIGDRTDLDDDVQQRLQAAGTYHVIAISGGNIALLAALVLGALRLAGVAWRLSSLITIAVLAGYAFVVGDEASVVRATLVAGVYLGARVLDHRTPPLNALAVAAGTLVAIRPLVVGDAGFLLSFGATLGILAGASALVGTASRGLGRAGPRGPVALLAVAGLGAATLCAELALFPISAWLFSRVTFAGVALNFLAIPLMSVVQMAGFGVATLSPLNGWAADRAGDVAALAAEALVRSAGLVEAAPWLSWRLAAPPLWLLVAYYGGWVGVLAGRSHRWTRPAGAVVTTLSGVLVLSAPASLGDPPAHGCLRVSFLDVGQGAATLVQFPNGRTLLVDAGGVPGSRFDVGGRVVSPALWRLGLRRLDYLAITHADPDHLGGAHAVLRDFSPSEVWEGVPVPRDEGLRALERAAARGSAVWRRLQAGDGLKVGEVDVSVRHPPLPDWERQTVRNDDSLVLEIRWGDVSVVLPGDIGPEVEPAIAASLPPAALRVLAVPHHGSASSSTRALLDAARPGVAIVSAGRGNPFGHPAPDVLDRYERAGAAVFRTDRDGAITLWTDGAAVEISSWTGRRVRRTLRRHDGDADPDQDGRR